MNILLFLIPFLLISYILYPKIVIMFNKNVKNVSGAEAALLIKENKELIVLDVRNKNEYQTGHINGSKLMPVSEIVKDY